MSLNQNTFVCFLSMLSLSKPHSDVVQKSHGLVGHCRMMDDQNSQEISVDFTDDDRLLNLVLTHTILRLMNLQLFACEIR